LSDSLSPTEIQNRNAYNRMAKNQHVLAQPVSPDELKRPLEVVDGRGWLGKSIRGWQVLCLAAGGGRHSILYSAAGANVTVVDISDGMLELDRAACEHYQFTVRMIQASMLSMPMLHDEEFDLVIHPVSTCYVKTLAPVFAEVSRVLRPGGLYISQHKSPFSLQTSLTTHQGKYWIETEVGGVAVPVQRNHASSLRETDATETAHSLEDILGGICRAGMVIEDLSEPDHIKPDASFDSAGHRAQFVRPYIRIKARRTVKTALSKLILP
jgi:SAM-dependent methyltransferase